MVLSQRSYIRHADVLTRYLIRYSGGKIHEHDRCSKC